MALQKSYTTVHGVTCPSAYHRIGNVRSRKKDDGSFTARCVVLSYFDAAARAAGNPPLATRSYQFPYDIESTDTVADFNLYTQGYEYLKTTSDFSGATDV